MALPHSRSLVFRCRNLAPALLLGVAIVLVPDAGQGQMRVSIGAQTFAGSQWVRDDEPARERAAKAVRSGAEAFARADYSAAIESFESALQLRPAAKLHYNIAVCHQRLMLAAASPDARAYHADQAIVSYNAYLLGAPEADDRQQVAALIEDLGGSVARPGLKDDIFSPLADNIVAAETGPRDGPRDDEPRRDDAALQLSQDASTRAPPGVVGDPPARDQEADQDPGAALEAVPAAARRRASEPLRRRGELQLVLLLGATPTLKSDRIEGETTGLLGLTGLRNIRPQFAIGGTFVAYGGGNSTPDQLVLSGGHVALTGQYTRALGKGHRLWLGGAGDVGFARQAVRARATAPAPTCSANTGNEALVGARHGLVGALRGSMGVLLGRRRRHTVAMHVMPAIAGYGRGSSPDSIAICDDGERPLESLGLNSAASVFIWLGVGYSVGF